MTQDEIKVLELEALIEDLRLNHEYCPKEVILQAADELERLSQRTEQEPVAWGDLQKEAQQIVESKIVWKRFIDGTPLANDIACWMADFALQHTHPPQRTWVGLTDEEIEDIVEDCDGVGWDVAQAIRAKLKEKNA